MKQSTVIPTNRQPTTTAPHVATLHRPSISQSTLAEILKQRREVKAAEKAVKTLRDALAERERSVIEAIEGSTTWPNASVNSGILAASVAYSYRRNVKWKAVAEEYLSLEFCELITEETEATVYPKLVIA